MAGAGIAASAAILATALVAGAQTAVPAPAAVAAQQPIVQVGPKGNILLRGTIASVTAGTITVQSWGGVWTVSIPSSATVLPAAATDYASQFKTGDFVGVEGSVATDANWTVNATIVRDWTYRAALSSQEKANVQSAQGIRSSAPRDYIGTASGMSGSSFTLSAANGTTYAVNTAANTEIVNRVWATLPFSGITNGDSVRVYGVDANGTVTAQIVRDVTVPAPKAATSSAQ